jgi:hypothetical protein
MANDFDNTIYIKENLEKEGNQPDFKGGLTIDGQQYTVSLWKNDGTKKSWASGKVSKWLGMVQKEPTPPPEDPAFNDEIPF